MPLSGLGFVYIVLPVYLAVFLLAPLRARPAVLLAFSLGFFLLVQPSTLPLMMLVVGMDYGALYVMDRFDGRESVRRGCVWFSVLKNILIVLYYSITTQLQPTLADSATGLLIYAFSGMSIVLEAYKREVPCERDPVRMGLYCIFFPKLYAGPLISYAQFGPQLESLRPRLTGVLYGVGRFAQGAFKSRILGQSLQELYQGLRVYPDSSVSVLSAWVTVFLLALSVYYRLSGWCDMAQGIGAMFGITLPHNFYYPYQSLSIADFFQRFNITVSQFIVRTVYTPLQEDQNGALADSLNILIVGMLMGLWFGFSVNYLVWGAYLAAFIILERYAYRRLLERLPLLIRRIYALCVVLSSFTIYGGDSLYQSGQTIARMFRFRTLPLFNDQILYLLASNWLLLLVSCFFATSICNLGVSLLRRALPRAASAILFVSGLGLLLVMTALVLQPS